MFWNPFAQTQQFTAAWTQAMKDQITRFEAMQVELERMERQNFTRATEAVDESARLAKESIAYAQKLQAEWRKIGVDAMKKSAEPFTAGL